MLSISTFFNNLVNNLIRNLSQSVRVIISVGFLVLALAFLYFCLKDISKDKPSLKIGWLILFLISTTLCVLYVVL